MASHRTNPTKKARRKGMAQTTRNHLQPTIGTRSAALPAASTAPTAKNDRPAKIAYDRSRAGMYSNNSTNLQIIEAAQCSTCKRLGVSLLCRQSTLYEGAFLIVSCSTTVYCTVHCAMVLIIAPVHCNCYANCWAIMNILRD